MTQSRKLIYVLVLFIMLIAALGCGLSKRSADEGEPAPLAPTTTPTEQPVFPEEAVTVIEPGGAEVSVAVGALSEEAQVTVEEIGEGVPFAGGSPFSPASAEYQVAFGGADQVGQIRMTVPLLGQTKDAASEPAQAYVVWAESPGGTPSVVGTKLVEEGIEFPVVGPGKYQVFKLLAHDALLQLFSQYDPLLVPTYQQRTSSWCSPTALTDLVNYHEGSWPVGGFGAVWGESSNWYLAGKAGQPFNKGYFFHWLLGAGGYTVPSDVKQSFSNGNAEVIIWNWNAALFQHLNPFDPDFGIYVDTSYAESLFDSFQAYIEYHVWGADGTRRPVAWGSSLAGHSRVITGSDGTAYYYNDPSSGSLNDSKTWDDYRGEVMASFSGPKIEVIDTVVLFAEPRPANERRGVIWLFPEHDGFSGSVKLVDGETGDVAADWVWDGSLGHANGYYYTDERGVLPPDPLFDVQFKALNYQDSVDFGLAVFNLTAIAHEYHIDVILQNENLSVLKNVASLDLYAAPEAYHSVPDAGSFKLYGLPPGLYTLKYVLLLDGIYQDVKYVQFRLAESDLLVIIPHVFLTQNAFCRKGPDRAYPEVTAFAAGTDLKLIGVNPDRTWGLVEETINQITFKCWVALGTTEAEGIDLVPVSIGGPLETEEPGGPVCLATMGREECEAAGGTYFVGAAGVSCLCPE